MVEGGGAGQGSGGAFFCSVMLCKEASQVKAITHTTMQVEEGKRRLDVTHDHHSVAVTPFYFTSENPK